MSSSPSFTKLIRKSIAKLSALGSGLAFKGWNNVITSITFDLAALTSLTDSDSLIYLDIGCGLPLMDRDWLAKKLHSQKISTMPVLLQIRSIGASKHELGEFLLTIVFILDIDKKGYEVYASIGCKVY